MTTTSTHTHTATFTEARAREVMHHVLGDFVIVANRGMIALNTIQAWHEEITYAVVNQVIAAFQLQFKRPDGTRAALDYSIRDDNTVFEISKGGGFDPYLFPPETKVSLWVRYRPEARKLKEVQAYLHKRGWTADGSAVEGTSVRDRGFSKNGYGLERSKVGDWE